MELCRTVKQIFGGVFLFVRKKMRAAQTFFVCAALLCPEMRRALLPKTHKEIQEKLSSGKQTQKAQLLRRF
jgi:hypothetical protein